MNGPRSFTFMPGNSLWYTQLLLPALKYASQKLVERQSLTLLLCMIVGLIELPKGHQYWVKICEITDKLIGFIKNNDIELYNELGEEVLNYIIRANLLVQPSESIWFHAMPDSQAYELHCIMDIKVRGGDTMHVIQG
jgi:hypothetical protein